MRIERMTLKELIQEKLKRLQKETKKKIDNLSNAELNIRKNLEEGLGDSKFEEKKLQTLINRALEVATKKKKKKARLEKLLKTLHESEVKKDENQSSNTSNTENSDSTQSF